MIGVMSGSKSKIHADSSSSNQLEASRSSLQSDGRGVRRPDEEEEEEEEQCAVVLLCCNTECV